MRFLLRNQRSQSPKRQKHEVWLHHCLRLVGRRCTDLLQERIGFETRFLHDSGQYGELNTGETVLAFASYAMGEVNLDGHYQKIDLNTMPFGVELAFVTDDVASAYAKAVTAGTVSIKEPTTKPWGQVVAYIRSREGSLIEFCSPISG